MNLKQNKTSPLNVWFDSGQQDPSFNHTTCLDESKIRSQCNTFVGSGASAIVLGNSQNKEWVFRITKLHKDDKQDTLAYQKLKQSGKCPPDIHLLTAKQLFIQNWNHIIKSTSSCLPKCHNLITNRKAHKMGVVMERLERFEDLIGKKAFKNSFANTLMRFILSAGMVFQNTGLTLWDIKADNICVRKHSPHQRFVVTIQTLPVDLEIDVPEGFAMVMVDFDDCTSLNDNKQPCTSPAIGIPDYYRPFCSVTGWCKTLVLRTLFTNDRESRIVWRSHSLLKAFLTMATVFFPHAECWLQLALDALAKNNHTEVIAKTALAAHNMDIVIYNYSRFETQEVQTFVQQHVVLKNKQQFWERFIGMLQDPHAPKLHFKSHFTVCLGQAFSEKDSSAFGLHVVQLARRLGIGVRMHIPTVTKGEQSFSEASSSISVVQSDEDGSV
jgi:hypothetical protein